MLFGLSKAWMSEIGLALDLLAFAILSYDLIRAMRGEREAREEFYKLQRSSFMKRWAVLRDTSKFEGEIQVFDERQSKTRAKSERDMRNRRWIAYTAIGIAAVGFVLQLIGGWPDA